MRFAAFVLLLAGSALTACPAGIGEGFVVGALHVENCDDGEPLVRLGGAGQPGTGPAAAFDLGADFFVGDPLMDRDEAALLRRSNLFVRIQETSNRIEQADSLLIEFHDLRAAANAFAAGQPVPITDCFDLAGCPSGGVVLRSRLNLYASCTSNRTPLTAANRDLVRRPQPRPNAGNCLLADGVDPPACPALSDADRQALDALCGADFDDKSLAPQVAQILGRDNTVDLAAQGAATAVQRIAGGACLYLCEFGDVRRGQAPEQLAGFEIEFGDRIAGIFSFNLVDGRALELETCAAGFGQIQGMFSFDVVRSRVAQAFP